MKSPVFYPRSCGKPQRPHATDAKRLSRRRTISLLQSWIKHLADFVTQGDVFDLMLGFIDYELLMSYSPQERISKQYHWRLQCKIAWLGYGLFREWFELVEPRRIELLTSCVQDRCSPS